MGINSEISFATNSMLGSEMLAFISELYPICRSVTGDGLRETLRLIGNHIPLKVREVPTGTQVFDWTIPKEWNIRDAYVRNSRGERVIDYKRLNLHVVNYSVPVKKTVGLEELKQHLHSIPEQPDWVPYRTSYYKESWGFCIAHNQLLKLQEDQYDVCIDSSLLEGALSFGELLIPGKSKEEVLISCHVCHPSLCNDNLSGIAVATFLGKNLMGQEPQLSYRILFVPVTIGAIAWLALNESVVPHIKHGLVLTCVGDGGKVTYKRSRRSNAEVDRAVMMVLKDSGDDFDIREFSPYGYDERQFCSPGFDLPVGCFMRTPNGCFPEYHTSADNLSFLKTESLLDSLSKTISILTLLDNNRVYINRSPKCEPQLGKRGLYKQPGTPEHLAQLWVLNLSDGQNTLLDVAERSGLPFPLILSMARELERGGLLADSTNPIEDSKGVQ